MNGTIRFKTVLELLVLIFLTAAIPITIHLATRPQDLRGKASSPPVVLTVDLKEAKPLTRNWPNLAQGGEVPIPQMPAAISQLALLSPRYIRIDHMFDAYNVVKRTQSGQIAYDFAFLDKEVDAIVKIGAVPFFSLSYIPNDIEDPRNNQRPLYDLWENLIAATISHYSGKRGKNLQNVYYEVYNEPNLFGKWDVSDYSSLYEASVKGASHAVDAQPFSIGGPAISYFDKTFLNTFLTTIAERRLRLDFVSWHTYTINPSQIVTESATLDELLEKMPQATKINKVVSEWGPFPEKHLWYDTIFGASHLGAVVARSLDAVDMLFLFEAKDGVSETNQKFFGGWGILTNEKFGIEEKPRYHALALLNKLKPLRFTVSGENETMFAIASGNTLLDLSILITSYSFGKDGSPVNVPVHFTHMVPGTYIATKTMLDRTGLSQSEQKDTFTSENTEGNVTVQLPADSMAVLDVKRLGAAVSFTTGVSGDPLDRAAKISKSLPPLYYLVPAHERGLIHSLSFSFSSALPLAQLSDNVYFESKSNDSRIVLAKETRGFASVLSLSVSGVEGISSIVSVPLSANDVAFTWHTITMTFDSKRALLSLALDGAVAQGALPKNTQIADYFTLGGFDGAIDNLAFSVDETLLLSDSFY